MNRFCIALVATLAACTNVPELDDRIGDDLQDAAYPVLVPLDTVLGPATAPAEQRQQIEDGLAARTAALRARAAALQAPVVAPSDRARLDAAVANRQP